ncbi:MAG TPA: hypothetical protein VFO38_05720 [Candidatus Saccharimonadales bacterium]|nr:hypothetical protein [Candidatus Saccharimonadales bacterium]
MSNQLGQGKHVCRHHNDRGERHPKHWLHDAPSDQWLVGRFIIRCLLDEHDLLASGRLQGLG